MWKTGAPVFGGVLVSNGDVGLPGHETPDKAVNYLGNNHGGLEKIGEKVYIFYHRHTHGTQYGRQGCAEEVRIQADGSIPQVEITSCGLNGGPLPAKGEYSVHILCALHGTEGVKQFSRRIVKNEADAYLTHEYDASPTATNLYLHNLQQGAGCGFKYFAFDGSERIVRTETRGAFTGKLLLHLDAEDGPIAAEISVSPTQFWTGFEAPVRITDTHAVYLTFAGEGTFNLNSIAFQ